MTRVSLPPLVRDRLTGADAGVTSVCTAHPLVIEAAIRHGKARARRVLIEATCNQVNQDGGYTRMTPAAFRLFVEGIADRVGFDRGALILGGDHLGPNPWKHLGAEEAMARAAVMIEAYASAGFSKLHLDTSMGCAGETTALPDHTTAARAARLAAVAEAATAGAAERPIYVIGTEVPVPGGALDTLDHLEVTSPEAALRTVEVHRRAFATSGLDGAFERAVGVVVQPGVEFGNADVIPYRREHARALSATLPRMSGFVFEAHSTDYQSAHALKALVEDGFAILKVGPWLTFALRETLYGLNAIAQALAAVPAAETLAAVMDDLMVQKPENWRKYYHGDDDALRVQRHFSYSDRIRYYWPHAKAQAAVAQLMERLKDRVIPETLISQFLGGLYPAVAGGSVKPRARDLLIASVTAVLDRYASACASS